MKQQNKISALKENPLAQIFSEMLGVPAEKLFTIEEAIKPDRPKQSKLSDEDLKLITTTKAWFVEQEKLSKVGIDIFHTGFGKVTRDLIYMLYLRIYESKLKRFYTIDWEHLTPQDIAKRMFNE